MEFVNEEGELGQRIAHRRLELGLTHAQVARRARLTEEYVRSVEKRPTLITLGVFWRLAAALETTPRRLLGGQVSAHASEAEPHEAESTLGR